MIEIQKITESAERHLAGTDLFVVECRCSAGNEIELTVDGDTSVSIDACAALSRAVEADLDREEEDFSLTVMSAGIGSELRCLRQYRRLIGSSVEVLLNNGVKLLAKLDGADEEGIDLSYEEKQAVEGKKRKGFYFDFSRVYWNKPEGYTYQRDRTWQFNNLKPRTYK